MSKEKVKREDNTKQEYYPTNHRIRPDDMSIMEAARIGQSYLEKNPNYEKFIEDIRNFEKTDGE